MDAIAAFLLSLATQYPIIASVLMIIGTLRLIIKPLFSFLHTITDATPSVSDNEFLAKVENSTFLKTALFLLDWLASVKVIK